MTRRPSLHIAQLAASQITMFAMTGLLLVAARGADGPHARAWGPAFGGTIALWAFAVAWALLVVCLTVRDALAAMRSDRHRPRPGQGGRPAVSLADLHDWQTARRERATADKWAGQDVKLPGSAA